MQVAVKECKGGQQYAKADDAMEQRCAHRNDWQYIQREHDLFDVIDVGKDERRCAIEYLRKQSMHNHADKQHHGELGFALFTPNAPTGLEDHGEDEGVHSQHKHRVEEGPGQPHDRAFVAADHFALGHLHDELAVAPKASGQCYEGCGLGGVGVDRC